MYFVCATVEASVQFHHLYHPQYHLATFFLLATETYVSLFPVVSFLQNGQPHLESVVIFPVIEWSEAQMLCGGNSIPLYLV